MSLARLSCSSIAAVLTSLESDLPSNDSRCADDELPEQTTSEAARHSCESTGELARLDRYTESRGSEWHGVKSRSSLKPR